MSDGEETVRIRLDPRALQEMMNALIALRNDGVDDIIFAALSKCAPLKEGALA